MGFILGTPSDFMLALRYVSLPEKYSRWLSTAASGGREILEKESMLCK